MAANPSYGQQLQKGSLVWAYQTYSTKKDPQGCPTWTGPWEVLGEVLQVEAPEPQWTMLGSLYPGVTALKHVLQRRLLWPFDERQAKRHRHRTEVALSSDTSKGSFMEIHEGWNPTDYQYPECPTDTMLTRPAPIGGEVEAVHPALSKDELRIRTEFITKVRELTLGSQRAGEPAQLSGSDNHSKQSHINRATPLSPLLESSTSGLQDYQPSTATENHDPWGPLQPDSWNPSGIPVYEIPLPSEGLPKQRPKGLPPGYQYSIHWYRNLCWSQPVPEDGRHIQHREVWVEHHLVEAAIDEDITVGIASRAFLATLAAYLPRIPIPVLLTSEQNVPPGTEATYVEIQSYTKGTHNICLHPILVAPSLEGESLVLGKAYLRDNLVTGFRSHFNPSRRDLRGKVNQIPQGWCQAVRDQNQTNHQFLYTTPWSTHGE